MATHTHSRAHTCTYMQKGLAGFIALLSKQLIFPLLFPSKKFSCPSVGDDRPNYRKAHLPTNCLPKMGQSFRLKGH